jgi:amidohydrolase
MLTKELIKREAARVHSRVVELRRAIHREPELGLATPKTQALILQELARIGAAPVFSGAACTSVWVDIEGAAVPVEGPRRVALRADMDALPLTEHADVAWASCDPGKMHACGHDGHVAMLLGAADVLHANRDSFAGTVRLLFQPGVRTSSRCAAVRCLPHSTISW